MIGLNVTFQEAFRGKLLVTFQAREFVDTLSMFGQSVVLTRSLLGELFLAVFALVRFMNSPDVNNHAGRRVEVQVAEETCKGGSDVMRGCQMGLQRVFLSKFRTAILTDYRWRLSMLWNNLP